MNLTLAVDEKVAEQARKAAQAMGKSLNQVVREYLEQLAGTAALDAELEELRKTSGRGNSGGHKFSRTDTYRPRVGGARRGA
jgi:antitoxin component of RelBE/YafQ-DinJ toxin-antitoxin module